jgi:predicted nucleic acid-binding protein
MNCGMNESVIIADSSPLIALARIDQLAILPQLFSRILAPPAVWDEVTVRGSGSPGAREVSEAAWIEIQAPDPRVVDPLTILVDRGEAEAIALAHMLPESTLLLDDARARRVAERLNIPRIGTLGLLRRAKQVGLIEALRPHLKALQASGIYIRPALIEAVLKSVGEDAL